MDSRGAASRLRGKDGVFAEPARMRFFTHKKVGTTEITRIAALPNAGLAVFDGELIEGCVTTDSIAELVHGKQHVPLHVKGVILELSNNQCSIMSLTVEIGQEALAFAAVGDRLICA